MSSGERWTPIYDRMFDPDHHLAGDPACQRWAFADLCHMAQWKDGARIVRGQVVPLPRGCFLASVRFLAERWQWSKSRVSRFLQNLQHPDIAKIETVTETLSGTVYRIATYDVYANPGDTNRDSNRDADGTPTGRQQGQRTVVQQYSSTTTTTASFVGDFCERTGSEWRLDKSIEEWAHEIQREPKYAGADIGYEIGKCADWHVSNGKTPRAPDMSIRNWLERAARESREHSRNGKRNRSLKLTPQEVRERYGDD